MPIPLKSVAAESMLTQGVDQQDPNPHVLNPNATAFTPTVCKNAELSPFNNPLSSDTNHVTASGYNINNSAGNTCPEAIKQEAVRPSQLETHNEETEVIARAPPINSIAYTLPETSGAASKKNTRGSLHPAALNKAAQMNTVSHELIIARAGSESAPRASVYTCQDSPYFAASKSSSGRFAFCETIGAVPGSESTRADLAHSRPNESYITALLMLQGSVKDEGLASSIRSYIDCVRRVIDLCDGVDCEAIKQSILDIESVVQKIASLCNGTYA